MVPFIVGASYSSSYIISGLFLLLKKHPGPRCFWAPCYRCLSIDTKWLTCSTFQYLFTQVYQCALRAAVSKGSCSLPPLEINNLFLFCQVGRSSISFSFHLHFSPYWWDWVCFQSNVHWTGQNISVQCSLAICISFLKKIIYLAALALCGIQASLVVVKRLSCSVACGILLPDQESNPCPLHWNADSTTGPLGKAWPFVFSFLH